MMAKLQNPGRVATLEDVQRVLSQWYQTLRVGVQPVDMQGFTGTMEVKMQDGTVGTMTLVNGAVTAFTKA